jgi:hypothetical protein
MRRSAALSHGAVAEVVVTAEIRLARTPSGRADQLEQLLAELPPHLVRRWGPLLRGMIDELRRAGKPDRIRQAVCQYILQALTEGRELTSELRAEAADTYKCSPSTVSRAIASLRTTGQI